MLPLSSPGPADQPVLPLHETRFQGACRRQVPQALRQSQTPFQRLLERDSGEVSEGNKAAILALKNKTDLLEQ
ncbi:MAG: hypothetical protein LBB80_01415 [Treponema sp.]|nr:hypothetical protein [Treponema sp.]